MLVIVSPAKKLDFETECSFETQTRPLFLERTNYLAKELKELQPPQIGKLMKLSTQLSELNYKRFQNFKYIYNPSTSKQAVFAFNGDTFTGLDIHSLTQSQVSQAQKKLRILSGLYGLLKPMDLIQAYRLEMGTKLQFQGQKGLYDYWRVLITEQLNKELKEGAVLVNCASTEYFKVVDQKNLNADVVTPVFKEMRSGELKIISFSAKRARGMMARYIIKNKIKDKEKLKNFSDDRYEFSKKDSSHNNFVFVR